MIVLQLPDLDLQGRNYSQLSSLTYLNRQFQRRQIFPKSEWQTALVACRKDLDAGQLSMLVEDQQTITLWCQQLDVASGIEAPQSGAAPSR